jgi:hypothetical protein
VELVEWECVNVEDHVGVNVGVNVCDIVSVHRDDGVTVRVVVLEFGLVGVIVLVGSAVAVVVEVDEML